MITKDEFINLQESPAVFFPLDSEIAQTILKAGTIIGLPLRDLIYVRNLLEEEILSQAAIREVEENDRDLLGR